MKNFVYIIGATDGPQKIGIARDVTRRLQFIQSGSYTPLAVAHAVAADAELAPHVENYAHWILREHRLSGEWFRVTPQEAAKAVGEAIEAVAKGERKAKLVRGRVGRPRLWSEDMQARFGEGTFDRIEAVLEDGEDRTDFVREAVERELKRRERHR